MNKREKSLSQCFLVEAVVKCFEDILFLVHFNAFKLAQIDSYFTTFHGWLGIGKLPSFT